MDFSFPAMKDAVDFKTVIMRLKYMRV
jgi:hypothetical protein